MLGNCNIRFILLIFVGWFKILFVWVGFVEWVRFFIFFSFSKVLRLVKLFFFFCCKVSCEIRVGLFRSSVSKLGLWLEVVFLSCCVVVNVFVFVMDGLLEILLVDVVLFVKGLEFVFLIVIVLFGEFGLFEEIFEILIGIFGVKVLL